MTDRPRSVTRTNMEDFLMIESFSQRLEYAQLKGPKNLTSRNRQLEN